MIIDVWLPRIGSLEYLKQLLKNENISNKQSEYRDFP